MNRLFPFVFTCVCEDLLPVIGEQGRHGEEEESAHEQDVVEGGQRAQDLHEVLLQLDLPLLQYVDRQRVAYQAEGDQERDEERLRHELEGCRGEVVHLPCPRLQPTTVLSRELDWVRYLRDVKMLERRRRGKKIPKGDNLDCVHINMKCNLMTKKVEKKLYAHYLKMVPEGRKGQVMPEAAIFKNNST